MPATTLTAAALNTLLDDASQFPPGNLELEPAWREHRRWRQSSHSATVGRLLLPAARADALAELIGSSDTELGVVIAGQQPEELRPLLNMGARITSIELRGAGGDAARWRAALPDATVFVEGADPADLASVREHDAQVAAKLRCGGLEPSAFPSSERVARFIARCVALNVPFKATAGLHEPLRHWDPEIGVFHHGFLNLWTATALAADGAVTGELVQCLEQTDAGELHVDHAALEQARRWFTGFGTCSIEEPLAGLAALGLVDV